MISNWADRGESWKTNVRMGHLVCKEELRGVGNKKGSESWAIWYSSRTWKRGSSFPPVTLGRRKISNVPFMTQ